MASLWHMKTSDLLPSFACWFEEYSDHYHCASHYPNEIIEHQEVHCNFVFRTVKTIRRSAVSSAIRRAITTSVQKIYIYTDKSVNTERRIVTSRTTQSLKFLSSLPSGSLYSILAFVEMFTLCSSENHHIHSRNWGWKLNKIALDIAWAYFRISTTVLVIFFLVFFSKF